MTSTQNPIALHYFRLSRHLWELTLTRIRQLGFTCIYTPIPWGLHEPLASKFDIRGLTDPRRDLVGFIELCNALNFEVILDVSPGPLTDLNLLYAGFPAWLIKQHPEIFVKDQHNKPTTTPTLEHPTYLNYVKRWFQTLSEALTPKQKPNGPILAQLSPLSSGNLAQNDHITKVQWPIWLRKRYAEGGVEAINAAYAPPTPYPSISQVNVTANLSSPAFLADLQEFKQYVYEHANQTYIGLLEKAGWALHTPSDTPPHAIEIMPDPANISSTLRWATTAPLGPEGTPRYTFWQTKGDALKKAVADSTETPLNILYEPFSQQKPITVEAGDWYRLLLNGHLQKATLTTTENQASLTYFHTDQQGQTDFYFMLSATNPTLDGYLGHYLTSLLAGQYQTLRYAQKQINQLSLALKPPSGSTSGPASSTDRADLSEAQAALSEANMALRKASVSIGALEDVFNVALNKPQEMTPPPNLLTVDTRQLGFVHQVCQRANDLIAAAALLPVNAPLTVNDYTTAYEHYTQVATAVGEILEEAFTWLREQLALGNLSVTAWTVHAYIQIILQNLAAGMIRL